MLRLGALFGGFAFLFLVPSEDMSLWFRVPVASVLLGVFWILGALVTINEITWGVPTRVRGTVLELYRPLWFRRRVDLTRATGMMARTPTTIHASAGIRGAGSAYEWGVAIVHPDSDSFPESVSDDEALELLRKNGYDSPVMADWVRRREPVFLMVLQNEKPVDAVAAIARVIEESGGTVDPSVDTILRSVRSVFGHRRRRRAERAGARRKRWRARMPWRRGE